MKINYWVNLSEQSSIVHRAMCNCFTARKPRSLASRLKVARPAIKKYNTETPITTPNWLQKEFFCFSWHNTILKTHVVFFYRLEHAQLLLNLKFHIGLCRIVREFSFLTVDPTYKRCDNFCLVHIYHTSANKWKCMDLFSLVFQQTYFILILKAHAAKIMSLYNTPQTGWFDS